MIITQTKMKGVFKIKSTKKSDTLGYSVIPYNSAIFKQNILDYSFAETGYTISKKNVIRGMYYQKKPFDYAKLVHVIQGEILYVVLDIREDSETFNQAYSVILDHEGYGSLYIEKGFAHGYKVISDSACVLESKTKIFNVNHDAGIKWDFDYDIWNIKDEAPIISEKDYKFPGIKY